MNHLTNQGDKVIPTEHTAKPAAASKIGRFALLRGLLTGKGSRLSKISQGTGAGGRGGRALNPSIGGFVVSVRRSGQTFQPVSRLKCCVPALLCALVGAFVCTSVARAETPKLISYGSFGDTEPFGVEVDQSTSDVYVSSLPQTRPASINKFDVSGKLMSPSPFGEQSGFVFYSGVAVNPTSGDVYVVESVVNGVTFEGNQQIDTYDPSSGALLSSFPIPGAANYFGLLTYVQIATDSSGNVFLPNAPSNEVQEYSPNGTLLQTFTGSGAGALREPTGVAVDTAGNVWVADGGNNRIEELSATGTSIADIESEGVQALALDAHGDVFAIVENTADFCGSQAPPCYHLVEYSSAGAQLADVGAGLFGPRAHQLFEGTDMLAVNELSGRVYVTDGKKNVVWVFGPPTAPIVGRELTAEVGTSEAKLGALVTPGGIATSYRFEYGATEAYGQTTPFPVGSVGEGITPSTVWAAASGLATGATYHYRVVATNELGTVEGADQTFTTETSAQASCPNEQMREGFSARLPDCRAYELVTPPTKASTEPDDEFVRNGELGNHAASDGSRMSYLAVQILPGSRSGGESYLSTRDANGWSSENVTPLQSYTGERCTQTDGGMAAYSADLSKGVMSVGGSEPIYSYHEGGCGAEGVEVVSGEPQGYKNLLLRDNTTGVYQLINVLPPGVTPRNANFKGASSDLSHVVFDERARLTANAPAGGVHDLYEWTGGTVRLVTVLPNDAPVAGSLADDWEVDPHVVSADGSRIFFTADGNLYVRVNGSSTVQVDASQAGGSGGGGQFAGASADGSLVFFTDDASAGLTSDTQPGSGTNLYRYDLETGQLTDLTPAGAEFRGVIGVSKDGSYVYFVALGSLATGATSGEENLYVSHSGTTTFITTEYRNILGNGARVSPNGAYLAFTSYERLTGYDNTDANTGRPDREIFLYSAATNRLVCASCDPSGEAPTAGGAGISGDILTGGLPKSSHFLSDSGRLFFDTAEALLPSDTNGQIDVYEYEGGQLHLISAGTSSSHSLFLDASESGNDVFFLSRQALVSQDTEEEAGVIYDARVGGGFPALSSPPPCTTADSCRSASSPQPSIFGSPASATFSGAGNVTPTPVSAKTKKKKITKCGKGFVKKKGRCVKTSKKAKKSNRKGRR
jgi:NHL repeat